MKVVELMRLEKLLNILNFDRSLNNVFRRGLKDAKAWFTAKLSDLDVDFMLLEKE